MAASTYLVLAVVLVTVVQTEGHGRLINPPGRSTMWRYGFDTPHFSNDHQLSCGGFGVQFYRNQGRCGLCGDPYNAPEPRDHEAGGKYALGVIAKTYKQDEVITVQVEVTVNHGGWFEFQLCPNNNPKKRVTEECFAKYTLRSPGGATRMSVPEGLGVMSYPLQLPKGLTCTQCVLRWRWNTASNVACDGAKCCRGCGNQEQFYGCSDVTIVPDKGYKPPTNYVPAPAQLPQAQTPSPAVNNPVNPGVIHQGTGNNGDGSIPDTYLPIQSGPQNGPAIGGGTLIGMFGRPNQHQNPTNADDNKCLATSGFLGNRDMANQWCVTHCKINICPEPLCNDACRRMVSNASNSSKMEACKATKFWRENQPGADEWCQITCKAGFCPKDYCDDACRS